MTTTKNARQDEIRTMLLTKPIITYAELEAMYPELSAMTLRRDIDALEASGDAIKVRGGARSMKFITNPTDDSISARKTENVQSKDAIARYAASFLETGRSIFIDSGTTLEHIVQYVPNERFIFTTTNPAAAIELSKIGQPVVSLVGGRLDSDYMAIYGPQAMRYIAETNIDIAFMSASGISAKSGCTGGNASECELKSAVIKKADKIVMLIDSSKLGRSMPYTFCDIAWIDVIISDAALPADIVALAKDAGTEIITVQ